MPVQCSHCHVTFRTAIELRAHYRDQEYHPYCTSCGRIFVNSDALDQHLRMSPLHARDGHNDSDSDPYCTSCNVRFSDMISLNHHLKSSGTHNWCFICSHDFKTPSALDNHCKSAVHNVRSHQCPFCVKAHKVPSGTAHHIESGACNHITRHQVTAAVHALNVVPTISVSRRLEGPVAPQVIVNYMATEESFNDDSKVYECPMCDHTFQTLPRLNTHLNSAAHDLKEFKCPKCTKEFTLISGLIQHIESGTCGVARISEVEDFATSLTDQFTRALQL